MPDESSSLTVALSYSVIRPSNHFFVYHMSHESTPTNTQFPVSVSLRVDITLYIAEVEYLFLMNVSLNLVEPQWVSAMHVQLVM